MRAEFSATRWERAYRRVVSTAFRRVPFYRDQWVAAGRALDEPEPTPSAALAGQLFRLCPFALPFDPSREPSLWTGDGSDLRDALALAGAPRRTPVLEVRAAVLDRRTLAAPPFAWRGPRYGVLLGPDAKVVDESRRHALNAAALRLAAEAGRAVVVGERAALDAVLPELTGVRVSVVERLSLARAAKVGDAPVRAGDAAVVHDPRLGYLASVVPCCGRTHLLWRHFHARPAGGTLTFTALRRRRPMLVNVVPDDPGTPAIAVCPEHGTPIVSLPA
ncbi:hypothetical protein MTP10_39305 [Nonomuraea sp. 3-1Str]|uniref:hypothetical protein n=1 Tax=Nonomuraea sp. 3-1Str TaxID=2929801 RepID=UPI002856D533|nr:hypothetical protein [Nonomuraea sp. 3-1Str]MDR8414762.1 hypothetical protein [Nonomuraea sp. 3-1Str]